MNDFLRRILFLPDQASTISTDVDQLHYFVIIVTMIISVLVGMSTIYFFWRYRRRKFGQLTPTVNPSTGAEIAFVTIPLIFFVAWFVIGYRDFVRMNTPPPNTMDVYVMGKQWMWKFNYADGPNSISTLRVPAGRPVRLLITSRDVIHSFFVPAFRLKTDAVPGRYTQMWFEPTKRGRYPIFCTEYCGLSHSTMTGEVVVMDPAEFDAWMAEQKRGLRSKQDSADVAMEHVAPESSLLVQGRQLSIDHGCVKCHTTDGSPHIGPTWLDLYQREEALEGGQKVIVDEAYLTESMMDPSAQLVQGFEPVMPSFRQKLSPPEVAALVEFIKSLRSDRIDQDRFKGPQYEPVRN